MTRRAFSLALAAAPLPHAPPIASIEVFPVVYPVTGYFKFFPKPERPAVFVKVTCQDGTFGWGQSVPTHTWSYETQESVTTALRNYLAPALIGHNPTDLAGAHAVMNRAIAGSFSTGMPIAKAGIDLALHDIAAKLAKQSLPQFWNRTPSKTIPLSWTVNVKSIAEAEPLLAEGRAKGYKHYNIKVAPDLPFDLALARAVRSFDKECFLWADANGGYDLHTALKAAPQLAAAGVNVLEQPLPPNHLTGLAQLVQQSALPILLDEGVVSLTDLEQFHALKTLHGVAMKPARTAGLYTARQQIQYLEKHKLQFLGSGLTDPDVSLAASLLLYAAHNLQRPAALNGPQFLTGSFLKNPFEFQDGALTVPTGHGIGVEVDEEKVRRHAHA